jgi:hypothetical protein
MFVGIQRGAVYFGAVPAMAADHYGAIAYSTGNGSHVCT